MIIDTSILVSVFAMEPERQGFVVAMSRATTALVASGSWVELATVLVRRFGTRDPLPILAHLRDELALTVVAMTPEHALLAAAGYACYGKGAGHRARLNFGDCFVYALCKATGEPLLFKGDDFNHTDLPLSPASSYP